ncbi:MAG TPA: cation:proton antiporter [Actinomycetota bacterium]
MNGWLFLVELGGVVLLLAALARVATRFGFSPIPLYLLAGLAFGRGGVVPLVTAEEFIEAGAEIGLILLLFSLGLEYSAQELVGSMRSTTVVGAVDVALNFTPGLLAGLLLGWGIVPAVFLGGVTYISSSGVIARTLDDLGWMGNRETPIVLAVLVIEDLVMAGFLPLATVLLVGGAAARVAVSIGLAVLVVVAVLAVAARYGPAISRAVFSRSDEALLLGILGLLLLTAGATESLNISAAVGAFLAGIALTGPAADRARSLLVPLRAVFAGVFFLFFGFQVDPGSIPAVLLPAVGLAAIGVATKYVTGSLGARRAGIGRRGRARAGVALIARGEFSIVIAGLAMAAGAEPDLGPLSATYVLLLAIVGPIAAHLLGSRQLRRAVTAPGAPRARPPRRS